MVGELSINIVDCLSSVKENTCMILILLNPLEHSVFSDATGLAIRFNMQSSVRRLRYRRLLVILAFCQ